MTKNLIRLFYVALIASMLLFLLHIPSYKNASKQNQAILNVFAWGGFLDPEVIATFEKETNIKVQLHLYNSNEEFLAKLKAGNPSDYDLIFPSDYAVRILLEDDMLQPIDKKRVDFISRISPYLLHQDFDKENAFSLPYIWEAYGVAIHQQAFDQVVSPSLKEIFAPSFSHKVVMTPDPVEAIVFGSHYLFGPRESLDAKEAKEIRKLLKTQKNHVEAYADYRAKYLIVTEHSPIALLKSGFICQLAKENPEIKYHLLKEGLFISIENIVLPKSCQNKEAAYRFMNYLYRPEILAKNIDLSPLFPACKDVLPLTKTLEKPYYEILEEIEERKKEEEFQFFSYLLPPEEMREMWVNAKN